jgi:glycine/D-amino acid oxidase-like deaminating enzyme
MKVDFIIVGQGLAGTLLAHELFRRNKSFVVLDDPDQPKASLVAAGLINPIVFRRMTKSWLVDESFSQMELTYSELENLVQKQLYYPDKLVKLLGEGDLIFWKEKAFANKLENYLTAYPILNFRNPHIRNTFGFACINKAGRLDIQKFISAFSRFLHQRKLIRKEKIIFEKLIFQDDSVIYDDIIAQKIIFCEGSSASMNPFFKNLKFKHSKGEVLEVKIPELKLDRILSGEVFVMPLGNDRYKVGATYSWDELNYETTDSASQELLDKIEKIILLKPEIVFQKAGIRPTMHDRKPVIGLLPENPNVGIFNGLGSKGVLLGPFFARQFADYLIGNSDYIHPEANVNRYFKHK